MKMYREEHLDQRWMAKNRGGWMDEVKRQKAEIPGRCGPGAMLM